MKLWPKISSPSSEKYEITDQPDQAPAYDINPLTLVCQYTASNCNISDPNYSYNCQWGSNFGTRKHFWPIFLKWKSLSVIRSAMLRNAHIVFVDNVWCLKEGIRDLQIRVRVRVFQSVPDCVRLSRQLVLSSKARRRHDANYEIFNKSRPPSTHSLQVQRRKKVSL